MHVPMCVRVCVSVCPYAGADMYMFVFVHDSASTCVCLCTRKHLYVNPDMYICLNDCACMSLFD